MVLGKIQPAEARHHHRHHTRFSNFVYFNALPAVSYYAPPPVTYYADPKVSCYTPPPMAYYAAPAVTYYAQPKAPYYVQSAPCYNYVQPEPGVSLSIFNKSENRHKKLAERSLLSQF